MNNLKFLNSEFLSLSLSSFLEIKYFLFMCICYIQGIERQENKLQLTHCPNLIFFHCFLHVWFWEVASVRVLPRNRWCTHKKRLKRVLMKTQRVGSIKGSQTRRVKQAFLSLPPTIRAEVTDRGMFKVEWGLCPTGGSQNRSWGSRKRHSGNANL